MRRSLVILVAVLYLVPAFVRAEDPGVAKAPKLLNEYWDALYLEGAKTGHYQTTVEEIERGGKKLLLTTVDMNLTLRRYEATVNVHLRSTTEETPEGKLLAVSFTQFAGDKVLTDRGTVVGDKLLVPGPDGKTMAYPWNDKAIGLNLQKNIFALRKVKPGDRFDWINYEIALKLPLTLHAVVKGPEEVDLLRVATEGKDKGKAIRVKTKLLRVEVEADEVKIEGQPVPLPRQVLWLDENLHEVRNETEQPGLGTITIYRTTKAVAQEKGIAPELLPDLGLQSLIRLNRRIEHPLTSKSATYRITLKGDKDPSTAFASDDRQSPQNAAGDSFELRVKAQRGPTSGGDNEKIKEEYLKSSFFLDSDNKELKTLANKIVGTEAEPWKKAQKIERWVHENMQINAAVEFIPASQIAMDRKGDCRQHGMLTAALCRAVGIPARTALGLIAVEGLRGQPILGFHLWTEVAIGGKWYGLDATLGQGRIGVGHIKVLDSGWANTQTLGPLVPLNRIMSKLKVEVIAVEE